MEFGNRERFSIMVCLEEIFEEGWLLGHFCYWIGGQQIGDYEDLAVLGDILTASTWICYGNAHGRPGDFFSGMSNQEIFDLINSSLSETSTPPVSPLPEELTPARYEVLFLDNMFGDWRAFMFSTAETSTILFKNGEDGELNKVVLENGEFEKIFSEAYDYISALEHSILPPD